MGIYAKKSLTGFFSAAQCTRCKLQVEWDIERECRGIFGHVKCTWIITFHLYLPLCLHSPVSTTSPHTALKVTEK